MKPVPQHSPASKAPNPIVRAVVTDAALCLMGFALFIQTGAILWLVGGAILGSAVLIAAVAKRVRERKNAPQRSAPSAKYSATADSNIIQLKGRPNAKRGRGASKSNWPFA